MPASISCENKGPVRTSTAEELSSTTWSSLGKASKKRRVNQPSDGASSKTFFPAIICLNGSKRHFQRRSITMSLLLGSIANLLNNFLRLTKSYEFSRDLSSELR